MTKKWSLQDIHPSEGKRKRPAARSESKTADVRREAPARREREREEDPAPRPRTARRSSSRARSSSKSFIVKLLILGIAVVGIGFLVSLLLGGASVTIHPKYKDTNVSANFTAHMQPAAGELGYEILSLEADGERQVEANGQEETSERAEGTITIYNEHTTNPVRLVKNTRFESPTGLIYRITESAVVPGYTTGSAGEVVPGTITAEVFADATGEEYNIGPSRFTIPGFEGEPEFDAVYAESNASFTGGFEGLRYIVDEDELASAQESLREELQSALMGRLANERPAGFILFDDAVTFGFETLPSTEGGNGLATIKERGTLRVPIFNESDFASYLAENTIAGYGDESVRVNNPEDLSFRYVTEEDETLDLGAATQINFALSGTARIIWTFDEGALKEDLAGLSRSALPSVLSNYPAILKAEANLRPFWKQSFPDDPDDLTIETVLEEGEGE